MKGKANASEMVYLDDLHVNGYVTYSWTETKGISYTNTHFINAAHPVSFSFAKAANNGLIDIRNGNNIYFRDRVESTANLQSGRADKSRISVINWNRGMVKTLEGAKLITDNLEASGQSIDVKHGAIGTEAVINLAAKDGISFASDKGNLKICQAGLTGGADNGKVTITADGSIVNADSSSLISAPAVILTSENGTIGAGNDPLRVKAGSTVTSSKLDNSSLTATARKDVSIVQTEGDMRIASIVSKEGDVSLEAKNGSIVDANGGAYTDDSSAEERLARWQELGMISYTEAYDRHEAAASESKARRLSAIEGRFQQLATIEKNGVLTPNILRVSEYKSAAADYANDSGIAAARKEYITLMQAAENEADRKAARAKLQAAKEAYFQGKGFSKDEEKAIADYGDLSVSENYGWSKNELLYAIQDGIVNAKPGTFDIVNNPNVIGKNIILTAKNGGIGYDEAAVYIKNADLTKAANMKLLASAKAGDLTWDANGVTIRRQVPVTLDIKEGGTVQLNGKKNVYVSAAADSALNIKGGIYTDGNIRLSAGQGVSIADGTQLRGKNLSIFSGAGSIGSKDKFLEIMLSGWLMANSGNSIYVHQNGNMPLTLLSVAAGMDAYLRADNGIRMVNDYGLNMGYVRAGRLADFYTKQGNIEDVRILANGSVVNAKAPEGLVTLVAEGGKLKIGKIAESSAAAEIAAIKAEKQLNAQKEAYKKDVDKVLEEIYNSHSDTSSLGYWFYVYLKDKEYYGNDKFRMKNRINKVNGLLADFLADKGYTSDEINCLREYIEVMALEHPTEYTKAVTKSTMDAKTAAAEKAKLDKQIESLAKKRTEAEMRTHT
ncbi:hypothetical protein SELR_pSRC700100 (plasmid) [Selenomonas ruminantium subsp. lactilytica TAM6421]|uniref:Uncharacterized protein n=2 Tax=Selenomonas ruminantium TaxID=971 RepID=I0GVK6_SELRL|nr:hypothetical protein SELR_pSRC700100 [Selenomonas ruminantium subsp. lactilytica TAM6421]